MSGFDIIGDIHGRGSQLTQLLNSLGYQGANHPDGRKLVFLGDYIDRGTEHISALATVRSLVDAGTAVALMGNHEFNAVCFARMGAEGPIRKHSEKNIRGHIKFLEEFPFGSEAHKEAIQWFETLPIAYETDGFRAIHACWHDPAFEACAPYMRDNVLTAEA
ncbi:MAG: hypothetical protein DI551_06670 [Micavibrio aeruginosavorus]|uniref:Calcineurin-like phosphoesterase domain-containing protein n=1 Tax=Micavibrio aeruginosavorus TaxID=349221 RepID=A0A2W5PM24_9BACT|nr:MAG: hypothetical protein DI551_06670 [Micavibrio aeruginosavorus]